MSLCDGWQFGHLTTGHLLPLTCFCGVFWEISFPAASKRLPFRFRKCGFDYAFTVLVVVQTGQRKKERWQWRKITKMKGFKS